MHDSTHLTMDQNEAINSEMLETFKELEELENEFTFLTSNFHPDLEPDQIEELENREREIFERYYERKKQLLFEYQKLRRRGKISPTCYDCH
jgi:hypothetical protein